jgi:hypothetical protein
MPENSDKPHEVVGRDVKRAERPLLESLAVRTWTLDAAPAGALAVDRANARARQLAVLPPEVLSREALVLVRCPTARTLLARVFAFGDELLAIPLGRVKFADMRLPPEPWPVDDATTELLVEVA